MKVGTDGVLLGSWASVADAHRALDIGTGTGLIALMLAQRNPMLHVDAIDIDADAAIQAADNAACSPWSDRIRVWHSDFLTWQGGAERYDLIVSNPPFYAEHTACPDARRQAARHTTSLPISQLLAGASSRLADAGCLSLIVPYGMASEVISEAAVCGLYLSRRTDVHTTPRKAPKRVLLEFTRQLSEADISTLCIHAEGGAYSDAYRLLTDSFYLESK